MFTISLYGNALAKESLPQGSANIGRLFIFHHYLNLNLSDLCLGVEKKILKEITHFQHLT